MLHVPRSLPTLPTRNAVARRWFASEKSSESGKPQEGKKDDGSETSVFPPHLLNTPVTKLGKLSNEMRVATEEGYGETATVGIFIDAGSAYETAQTNGVAHFLEHMAFKGTSKRTKQQIEQDIENMGGSLNAYTSREQTVYLARVFKDDVPKAVDILADILLNSELSASAIEAERGTILREMEEVNKDDGEVIFDQLHAAAYQGTPLGRTILGPAENIKSITRDHLQNYIKTHYTGRRMILAGAGAVRHEELMAAANKSFGTLPAGDRNFPKTGPGKVTGSLILHRDDAKPHVHVAVGVEGVGWAHPDYYTMQLMQTIVGNWDKNIGGGKNLSSKLIAELTSTDSIRSLNTFTTCYGETGLFGSYFVGDPEQAFWATRSIPLEWARLGQVVSEGEIERAKNRLKASTLMALDGTQAICEDIGRQILHHGRRMYPAETFLRIDAISKQDIMRVARERCEDVDPVMVAIGPTLNVPDYNLLRSFTLWNRL